MARPGRSEGLVGDAPPRTVYRVVRSDPPAARDFLSAAALGRRFNDSRLSSLADGISVFETEAQARRQAVRYNLGRLSPLRSWPSWSA